VTIQLALIAKYPQEWIDKFKTPSKADRRTEELQEKNNQLKTAVELSIQSEAEVLRAKGLTDRWLDITEADFAFLTETNSRRVGACYVSALQGSQDFHKEAAFRQVDIFRDLGVLTENVTAAVKAIGEQQSAALPPRHCLLFTGHMIDRPDRKDPRFPAAYENSAKQKIREAVEQELKRSTNGFFGIAGGACGGDILFHEVCADLGIPTELYLALPRADFIRKSVEFAGPQWIDRFDHLYTRLRHHTLCDTESMPKWLHKQPDYGIWERNNLWELNSALVNGGTHVTLIALWDRKGGDGPGGTAHMVREAAAKGAKTVIINTNTLTN
jgi:hypothetical protein